MFSQVHKKDSHDILVYKIGKVNTISCSEVYPENQHMSEDVPRNKDILFGRGPDCWNHDGNKNFRITIANFQEIYHSISNRAKKVELVAKILDDIQAAGARFLKQNHDSNKWKEVDRKACIEKVCNVMSPAALDSINFKDAIHIDVLRKINSGGPCY